MNVHATVFTSESCFNCDITKRALKRAEIPYTEIDVNDEPSRAGDAAAELGSKQLPMVFLSGDGEVLDQWSGLGINHINDWAKKLRA